MAATAPNIILILCDELRADALGCLGSTIVQTPHLDRLAAEGTLFTQCMITQPTCTPSRASILTGCYPSTLRTRMVGCDTPDDPRFLPRVLAQHGYHTASIGKIHLVPQRDEPATIAQRLTTGDHTYYGFQEIDLVNGHGDGCFGPQYSAWLQAKVPDWAERLQQRRPYAQGVNTCTWELPPEVHSSQYIADRAVDFLARPHDQPFFLHVSFPDPHYPFTVPEPYASRYRPEDMPPPIPPVTESEGMPPLHTQVYQRQGGAITRPDGRPTDRIIGTPPHDYARYTPADWQQVKAIYYGMVTLLDDCIGRVLHAVDANGLRDNTVVVFLSDHGDYLGDHGFYGKGLPYDSVLRVPLIWRGTGYCRRANRSAVLNPRWTSRPHSWMLPLQPNRKACRASPAGTCCAVKQSIAGPPR
jgi:arylsulfatase